MAGQGLRAVQVVVSRHTRPVGCASEAKRFNRCCWLPCPEAIRLLMACWQAKRAEKEIRLFAGHWLPCVWYRQSNVVPCMAICFTFAVSFERGQLSSILSDEGRRVFP